MKNSDKPGGTTRPSAAPGTAEEKAAGKVPPHPPSVVKSAKAEARGAGTPANATSAGGTVSPPASRRAQGWHTAVDGGAAIGPKTGSILSTNPSSLGRRHSVQFSEDTPMSTPSPRGPAHSGRAIAKEDAAFRLNMVDFLGVMYGDKKEDSVGAGPSAPVGPRARASAYRTAATAPQNQPSSPDAVASGKGPQIKGKTASSAAAVAVPVGGMRGRTSARGAGLAGGGSGRGGDGIDVLVDHLVRAYSSRMGGSGGRGGFTGMEEGGETPISYNGGRRKGPVTGHRSANDASEVSTFVSNALDSFFSPASARGANQLASTKSILSSLGLDENFAHLLSFKTHSNLANNNQEDSDGESTQLKPMYIGEQAMFHSVTSRPADVSASKSLSVMRGVIPPAPSDSTGGGADNLNKHAAAPSSGKHSRAALDESLDSAELLRPAQGTSRKTAAAAVAPKSAPDPDKSFTLDSKALLGADGDEDDSWGEVDAEAAAAAKAEREKSKKARGDANDTLVKGTRSLLELAKDRSAVQELVEQETLSRNVVMALEEQFRTYLVTTLKDAKGTADGRGRRRAGEGSGATASTSAATTSKATTATASGASARRSSGAATTAKK